MESTYPRLGDAGSPNLKDFVMLLSLILFIVSNSFLLLLVRHLLLVAMHLLLSTILVTSGDWKTVNLQGGARCDGVTSGSHQVPVYKAL